MASERKTLIVFDTNKIRQTIAGGATYGSFDLSAEFKSLTAFIKDNNLTALIDIAIPRIVLDELLKQKIDQYCSDLSNLSLIMKRLSEIPGVDFSHIVLPAREFDCKLHLQPLIGKFINDNGIKLINLPEGKLVEIFKAIQERAIAQRPPFKGGDKGFKDTVAWESLLNYDKLADYDKVIFISDDKIFNEQCKEEFEVTAKRFISMNSSVELAITELGKDYQESIEKNKFIRLAESDYFKDYLSNETAGLRTIEINGVDIEISDLRIVNHFESVEYLKESEVEITPVIISSIKGKAKINGNEEEVNIKAKTYLDDAMGIDSIEFEISE